MLVVSNHTSPLSFPSSWAELTLGQFMAVTDSTGSRSLLQALASDAEALANLPAGYEANLITALSFIFDVPDIDALPVPETIAGILPPKHANLCPLVQKWCLEEWEQTLREAGQPTDSLLVMALPILSIYLYTPLTGEVFTDLEQAYSIRSRIESLPALEALALTRFFLSSYALPILSGPISFSTHYPEVRRNGWLKRLFRNWPISISSARYPHWRVPAV